MSFSPARAHELLVGYQYLMSTTDGGAHWQKLSPDLTFDPLAKVDPKNPQPNFNAISSFSASPIASGVIWAATSNGMVKLTRNHGGNWEDVSFNKLPSDRKGFIQCVEASATDPATAYVCAGRSVSGKFRSMLFRTHDYGQTWKAITPNTLPGGKEGAGPGVVRSDPKRPGLLFGLIGSDVAVSLDDGETWNSITLNLPSTATSDITIHGNDLVLGTFGRGIWILDDYSALREVSAKTVGEAAHLFKPADAYRLRRNVNGDTPMPPDIPHAENPPLGAVIYYSLGMKPAGPVRIEIADSKGRVVRHFSSLPIETYDDPKPLVATYWAEVRKPIPAEIGLNRINWNIRYDTPNAFTHDVSDVMGAVVGDTPEALEGPLALPGQYTVRLIVDGKTSTQTFTVRNDPRSVATARDLALENQFRLNYVAAAEESWTGYHIATDLHKALAAILDGKPKDTIAKPVKALDDKVSTLAGTVSRQRRFYGPPPPTSFVNINGYLLEHLDSFDYGDMAPSDPMLELYGSDWSKLNDLTSQWRLILKKDLPALNSLLTTNGLPAVAMPSQVLTDPPAPASRFIPPKPVK
jgi:hypothetical protein